MKKLPLRPHRKANRTEQPDQPEPEVVQKPKSRISGAEVAKDIARLLKFSTFEPEQHYWLDTGSPDMNAALGSRDFGIPYGKIIEIAGEEHAGKTTVSVLLGALAQQDGAGIGRVDVERSQDDRWDGKFVLDTDSVVTIYPKLVIPKKKQAEGDESEESEAPKKGKRKKKQGKLSSIPRLQTAEELFAEMEVGMARLADAGYEKQLWYVDSVPTIQTEMQVEAGSTGRNMRTSLDRAMFLSEELPRLAGLAANYNAMIILINQLRDKQGLVFGDPTYSPGGRAMRHCCSVRVRIRRCKHGQLRKGSKIIGLVSIITNIKNKAGGGSLERQKCGVKIRWNKTPAVYEFMPAEDAEAVLKGGE